MQQTEVIALAGWPPEVLAYAMAKYSRSSLSIRESLLKITTEMAADFLDSIYIGYGHKSVADMAHVAMAVENASEIVAFYLEDEQLWDGQERSTRYQKKFSDYVIPAVVKNTPAENRYCLIANFLVDQHERYSPICFEALVKKHPKPNGMSDGDY